MPASATALAELVGQLVAINSVNPSLVPGGAGESEIATFVANRLQRAGLEVEILESTSGRPNVVARARGRGGGRTLMLNGHLDTVGVAGMDRPHQPRVDGGRLYGRGAFDMKGSLAACIATGEAAVHEGLAGDVVITAVADEEHSSIGAHEVARHLQADAAIVAEPTGLDHICIAHKGFAWLEITVQGHAAHGSLADVGVDAIVHAGAVLIGLEEMSRQLTKGAHPLLGSGSVHASTIRGGQELSSYPARCVLQLERRTLPGETRESVERETRDLLESSAKGRDRFSAELRTLLWRDTFEVDADAQIVTALQDAVQRNTGRAPRLVGRPSWMDAAVFQAAGIPTAIFGPGGEGAHALVEWVNLDDVARCAEIYLDVARRICG
jgi:acetylornithine deacetylase